MGGVRRGVLCQREWKRAGVNVSPQVALAQRFDKMKWVQYFDPA
jgi:hypothetical protein